MDLDPYRWGITEKATRDIIVAIAKATQPDRVLEIGTSVGVTTGEVANVISGEIVGIEKKPNRVDIARERLADLDNVTFLYGDSLEILPDLGDDGFDMAFVDGDHSEAYVVREIRELARVVRKGGLILLHDVFDQDRNRSHIGEICRAEGGVCIQSEIVHRWGGLGIIENR